MCSVFEITDGACAMAPEVPAGWRVRDGRISHLGQEVLGAGIASHDALQAIHEYLEILVFPNQKEQQNFWFAFCPVARPIVSPGPVQETRPLVANHVDGHAAASHRVEPGAGRRLLRRCGLRLWRSAKRQLSPQMWRPPWHHEYQLRAPPRRPCTKRVRAESSPFSTRSCRAITYGWMPQGSRSRAPAVPTRPPSLR